MQKRVVVLSLKLFNQALIHCGIEAVVSYCHCKQFQSVVSGSAVFFRALTAVVTMSKQIAVHPVKPEWTAPSRRKRNCSELQVVLMRVLPFEYVFRRHCELSNSVTWLLMFAFIVIFLVGGTCGQMVLQFPHPSCQAFK